MPVIRFTIPGRPKGKDRPRTAPGHDRPYTPKETIEAEKRIRDIFRNKFPAMIPWNGPILLRFTAVFETPKGFKPNLQAKAQAGELYATCKPDKDNIEKLIADAINGIAFTDDAQLQGGGVKRYGSPERVDVVLELVEGHPVTPSEDRRVAKQQAELDFIKPRRRRK